MALVLPGYFKQANSKSRNVATNENEDNEGADLGQEEVSRTPIKKSIIESKIKINAIHKVKILEQSLAFSSY